MNFDSVQKQLKKINQEINFHYFNQIDSTNSYAYYLGQNGYGEWNIVFAEEQSKGQGRLNRKWESPRGKSLLFSFLLKPSIEIEKLQLMSLFFGEVIRLSLQEIVESLTEGDFEVKTKWPNDVYFNGKKICGILIKSAVVNQKLDFVVVGIGININQNLKDFKEELRSKATSLKIETGLEWNREEVFIKILNNLYLKWKNYRNHLEDIVPIWKQNTLFLQKKITVHHFDNLINGIFLDINEYGHLILKTDSGKIEVLAGDVSPEV